MAATGFVCIVNEAGPTTLHSHTPIPEILIRLSDTNGSFTNAFFFAAGSAKNQMLAVALAAISTQEVSINCRPPNS